MNSILYGSIGSKLLFVFLGALSFSMSASQAPIKLSFQPAPEEWDRQSQELLGEMKIKDFQVKELVSYDQAGLMCDTLYTRITKDNFVPTLIIGLGRGGWMPATHLAGERCFDNRNLISIGVQSYEKTERGNIKFTDRFPIEAIQENQSILIVDDIADTGKTLQVVQDLIKTHNAQALIKTAVLYCKSESSCLIPNYFIYDTNKWVEFPWEKQDKTMKFIAKSGDRTFGYFLKK